jgi:dipeptidyl aminopeptidase/acylaminoacyl peptidase
MKLRERRSGVLVLALALLAVACSGPAEPEYTVTFRDRVIDLEPFLVGYPYSGFRADLEHGNLFYFEKTAEGTWLRRLPLTAACDVDLEAGARVTDVDWSTRSFWSGKLHPPSNRFFITSDEENDEHTNVYAIDLASGDVSRLTENDYTYGWGLSDDDRYLAYLDRRGLKEPFDTRLVVRDLETGDEREVLKDGGGADRFTWSYLRFTKDNESIVLTIQHDGQRNTTSLAIVDWRAEAPRLDYLVPPRVKRFGVGQVEDWVGDGAFLYLSSEEGFRNLYRYDLGARAARRLTDFRHDIRGVEILDTEPKGVLLVVGKPHESEIHVVDAATGKTLVRELVAASVGLMDAHGTAGLLSMNSLETPFAAERIEVTREGDEASFARKPCFGFPAALREKLSHLTAEKVSYPTFDKRDLHAFLLEPKVPPEDPADRLVTIVSFYGGRNGYSTLSQILAAAGIATLSPSPRGSGGFGAEFAALNDGDLGGDEIVDILFAAQWLVSERGYEPAQIGVRGGSHGGYATMRCLTFPPETNGRGAGFPLGFGWSHAGFSDILTFYDSCNIPDWVVKEAGDPAKEAEKLRDRSPLSHVERLAAPILLTHGSNDWRVPVTESRRFAARAEELGKPVTFVEFEGQGHGIRGLRNQVRYYQTVMSFLEGLGSR